MEKVEVFIVDGKEITDDMIGLGQVGEQYLVAVPALGTIKVASVSELLREVKH